MLAVTFFQDLAGAWDLSRDTFAAQVGVFLSLTLRALGLSLLVGIPTGLVLTRVPRLANPVIAVLAVVQTVPALVLLALLIPILGIRQTPALAAAVVYSVFPIVVNTYVGITQVSPAIRDAARGMGMTRGQVLWHVELPLAFPVLLVGVRTAAVYTSGMIVLGAVIGAGGLGDYIYNGISRGNTGLVWLGTLPVLGFTLLLFWGLGAMAVLARRDSTLGLALGGALIVLLSGYAAYGVIDRQLLSQRADVVVGAKDFTEGQILAQIVKQVLQDNTDLRVEIVSNLGTTMILNALRNGQIDVYPEYTGNLLTSKEALDMPVPDDKAQLTALVRAGMYERYGLVLLEPFGLNNTYAPCVTQETARRYALRTISDLRRVPQLRVVIDLSFLTRPDGWEGMVKRYGLHFDQPPTQVGPDLLYKALEQGSADLVIGFATDWQIAALNLVVLADDRGYFPSYHAAPLVREGILRRYPQVEAALNRLGGQLDDQTMRRLNFEVARNKRSEVEVAHEFLQAKGLMRR
jgi:osmoprotectant transport system permease protein